MEVRILPPALHSFCVDTHMVVVLYWFRNLAVNQVYIGSIPIGHPARGRHWLDEGAVLKQLALTRFGVRVPGLPP